MTKDPEAVPQPAQEGEWDPPPETERDNPQHRQEAL